MHTLHFEHKAVSVIISDHDEWKDYLDNVWENRRLFYDDNQEVVKEKKIGRKGENILYRSKNEYKARNFVGVLQCKGQRVNIWPKIFQDNKTNDLLDDNRQFLNHLIYYLSYATGVKFPFTDLRFEVQEIDDLLDAFIRMFANYAERVLSEQPYQRYEEITEVTGFMRGRLAVQDYITNSLSTGQWQQLYCTYEPFLYDNLFNRIVKYTTRLLSGLSDSNSQALENIIFLLDEVSDVPCTASDCDRVQFNPIYQDLQHILDMCRMFLAQEMINYGAENQNNFSFILPMERVFEDFFAGFLQEHFSNEWKIEPQKSDKFLTMDGVFQLRHDILLEHRATKRRIILDTKYKERKDPDDPKGGISQGDMYQMISYISRRENCHDAILLYPGNSNIANKKHRVRLEFEGIGDNGILNIHAYNINIYDAGSGMKDLENGLIEDLGKILNEVLT